MNLPNKITIARICLIPIFVLFFYLEILPHHFFIATILFVLIAGTDFLDGYIARKYNLVTNLGKFLDPIADKVLVTTAYILILTRPQILTVLWNNDLVIILSAIAISLILAREFIVSGFRMFIAKHEVVLAADKLGKIKTVMQLFSIFLLLLSIDCFQFTILEKIVNGIGLVIFVVALLLTILSGYNYIFKNRVLLKDE